MSSVSIYLLQIVKTQYMPLTISNWNCKYKFTSKMLKLTNHTRINDKKFNIFLFPALLQCYNATYSVLICKNLGMLFIYPKVVITPLSLVLTWKASSFVQLPWTPWLIRLEVIVLSLTCNAIKYIWRLYFPLKQRNLFYGR